MPTTVLILLGGAILTLVGICIATMIELKHHRPKKPYRPLTGTPNMNRPWDYEEMPRRARSYSAGSYSKENARTSARSVSETRSSPTESYNYAPPIDYSSSCDYSSSSCDSSSSCGCD